ncbi:hypothetical protein ACA910_016020 [Epithemia clementina (nom. ined.)]
MIKEGESLSSRGFAPVTAAAAADDESSIQALQDERRALIQIMEEYILDGTHVGNTLYQVACVIPGDVGGSIYPTTTTTSTSSSQDQAQPQPQPQPVDEYTRKARLERLFEGLSNMGRRGAKHALTVLFDAVYHQQQQEQQQQQSSSSSSSTSHNPLDPPPRSIPPGPFVELGYRLALATGFMQAIQAIEKKKQHQQQQQSEVEAVDNDDSNDEMDLVTIASKQVLKQFTPKLATKSLKKNRDTNNIDMGLAPMVHSLTQQTKTRLNREGILTQNQKEWNDTDPATVELTDVLEWSEAVAPLFASILPTFLFHILFWGRPFPPTRTSFEFPNHRPVLSGGSIGGGNTKDANGTSNGDNNKEQQNQKEDDDWLPSILDHRPRLFALACTSSALMGPYFRLYTSAADGLSFNRIMNALLGYSGPTLLLIRSLSGGEFGAFTSHTWKETKDFYGNSDCFLFQLYDSMAVYRPTGRAHNYMYCNSHARSKGYDQQAHGIGFGGTVQQPRLFIAENIMEQCQAASQDMTFENGALLPRNHISSSFSKHGSNLSNSSSGTRSSAASLSSSSSSASPGSSPKQFDIESMEIWGVGGQEIVQQALQERKKVREQRDETIRRCRKVDKAQFLDDFRSGAIASKAFAYRDQIDGRADQDVKDRNARQKSNFE